MCVNTNHVLGKIVLRIRESNGDSRAEWVQCHAKGSSSVSNSVTARKNAMKFDKSDTAVLVKSAAACARAGREPPAEPPRAFSASQPLPQVGGTDIESDLPALSPPQGCGSLNHPGHLKHRS
jgi:hypothetical protein